MNCNRVVKLVDMKKGRSTGAMYVGCDGWRNVFCWRRIYVIQHRAFGHSL